MVATVVLVTAVPTGGGLVSSKYRDGDNTAPTTPTGVSASVNGSTVTVSWTASTDATGVLNYRVYRDAVYVGSSVSSPYVDQGVANGTDYSYTVAAVDASYAQIEGSVGTASPVTVGVVPPPPDVPISFTAGAVSSTQIDLSWQAGPSGSAPTSYELDWSPNGSTGWTNLVSALQTSYSHTGRTADTTYYYRVRAVATGEYSAGYATANEIIEARYLYPYVVPGIAGFGVTTRAGASSSGEIYHVTSLGNTLVSGTLRHAVETWNGASATNPTPRTVVFDVGGNIGDINGGRNLYCKRSKLTIAGQTAPSPGITYRGGGPVAQYSDLLCQHLRFRAGDGTPGVSYDNRDSCGVGMSGPPETTNNVVFANCTFSWSIDEAANCWYDWNNVTYWRCIFGRPLHASLHSKGSHGYGPLAEFTDPLTASPFHVANVAFIECLLACCYERNPLSRATRLVFANNLVFNRGRVDIDLQGPVYLSPKPATYSSIVGNHFLRGLDNVGTRRAVSIGEWSPLQTGSQIYLASNISSGEYAPETAANQTTFVTWVQSQQPSWLVGSAPVWPADYTALVPSGNSLRDYLLLRVGARPADQDVEDAYLVGAVADGTARIINSVAGSTGWQEHTPTSHTPAIPANPHGTHASGYTNLEVWLHAEAEAVE